MSAKKSRPMDSAQVSGPLTIGALSRATNIPVETLRTWERRYGAPQPERKPSGHRLYPAASVEQLRRVTRLLNHGHRPGEIVRLSVRELDSMLALSETRMAAPERNRAPASMKGASLEPAMGEMIRAAMDLDRESLTREFQNQWARLGPLRFLEECAGAFMTEVGSAWRKGALEIRHEHFASACISDFLREVREPYDHRANGPRIVAATLPGDAHDGGLLMACVLMAMHNWRVVYLGANTPVDQIAAAVKNGAAEVATISISAAISRPRATKALVMLRAALPHRTPLWVGGAGAPSGVKGVQRFETLAALEARLAAGL